MTPKYSALEKLLVLELYDKTGNKEYIKNVTGISKKTITTWIKDTGQTFEKKKRKREKCLMAKRIFDDIYEGYSMETIMKMRKLTKLEVIDLMDYYIRYSFDKIKVNSKELLQNKRRQETEEMIERLKNGDVSLSDIAREQKVTTSAISKRLSRHREKWGT